MYIFWLSVGPVSEHEGISSFKTARYPSNQEELK